MVKKLKTFHWQFCNIFSFSVKSSSYKVNDDKVDSDIERIHASVFDTDDSDQKLKELMKNTSKPRVTFADEKSGRKKVIPTIIAPKLSKKLTSILEDSNSSEASRKDSDEINLINGHRSSGSEASTSSNISPIVCEKTHQSWFENPLFNGHQPSQQEQKQQNVETLKTTWIETDV